MNTDYTVSIDSKDIQTFTAPNKSGEMEASGKLKDGKEYTVVEMDDEDYHWVRVIKAGDIDDPGKESKWIYVPENTAYENSPVQPATNLDYEKYMDTLLMHKKQSSGSSTSNNTDTNDVYTGNSEMEDVRDAISQTMVVQNRENEVLALFYNEEVSYDDKYLHYFKLAISAYGAPPQWTEYVDPRVVDLDSEIATGRLWARRTDNRVVIGRKYADTIVANPTIISLCPGEVKSMLSRFKDSFSFSEDLLGANVTEFINSSHSGQIVEFMPAFTKTSKGPGYIQYVDTFMHAVALALSRDNFDGGGSEEGPLSERNFPNTTMKYKDYTWGNYDGKYTDTSEYFGAFKDSLSYRYVNFFGSGQNSVREEFSTDTRSSSLEDLVEGTIGNTVKDVAFLTGGILDTNSDNAINQWMSDAGTKLGGLGGLISNAAEYIRGGHICWPKIIDSCTYGKSMTFTCRFAATSGEVEDRYLNVLAPYFHILPFVLPRHADGTIDMFINPFLVRASARGLFTCNMGVVTNFQITKGGQDDSAWTTEGQPTEIEVSFDITPLYSNLYMSDYTSNPISFLKNHGMLEYISTLCGIDMRLSQFSLRTLYATNAAKTKIVNYIPNAIDKALNNDFTNFIKKVTAGF